MTQWPFFFFFGLDAFFPSGHTVLLLQNWVVFLIVTLSKIYLILTICRKWEMPAWKFCCFWNPFPRNVRNSRVLFGRKNLEGAMWGQGSRAEEVVESWPDSWALVIEGTGDRIPPLCSSVSPLSVSLFIAMTCSFCLVSLKSYVSFWQRHCLPTPGCHIASSLLLSFARSSCYVLQWQHCCLGFRLSSTCIRG